MYVFTSLTPSTLKKPPSRHDLALKQDTPNIYMLYIRYAEQASNQVYNRPAAVVHPADDYRETTFSGAAAHIQGS
jgi:hypothetical protein